MDRVRIHLTAETESTQEQPTLNRENQIPSHYLFAVPSKEGQMALFIHKEHETIEK